jgi:hypothetical protein
LSIRINDGITVFEVHKWRNAEMIFAMNRMGQNAPTIRLETTLVRLICPSVRTPSKAIEVARAMKT